MTTSSCESFQLRADTAIANHFASVVPGYQRFGHPPRAPTSLRQAVESVLSTHRRVLVRAVVIELEGLASTEPPIADWAAIALGRLEWLGKAVKLDDPVGTDLARTVQEELAVGRPLKHNTEHYGEAVIIALASRAQKLTPLMLSDDYDARFAAHSRRIRSFSVHRLIHMMLRQSKISEMQAEAFVNALFKAGRSQDYTVAELVSGRLGCVGRP